jgi:pilus assembly protein Flp/PilA
MQNFPDTLASAINGLLRSHPYIDTGVRGRARSSMASCAGRRTMEKELVVRHLVWNFLGNEQGATAIEYGLIAAGIAVAIIATVFGLGTSLNSTFGTVSSSLK